MPRGTHKLHMWTKKLEDFDFGVLCTMRKAQPGKNGANY